MMPGRQPHGHNPFTAVLTVTEAATAKGVNESWVKACCRDGTLAAWKVGKHWFIPVQEVERWETGTHTNHKRARGKSGG